MNKLLIEKKVNICKICQCGSLMKMVTNRRWFEPPHDKSIKLCVCPVKTQISLGIHPVWSESSQCAQWVAEDPMFLHAHSEDSDQTAQMPRLIWVFAERTGHFFFFERWLIYICSKFFIRSCTIKHFVKFIWKIVKKILLNKATNIYKKKYSMSNHDSCHLY